MKWFRDLIDPDITNADPREWLQLMSFFVAVGLAGFCVWLVSTQSLKGQVAADLMFWLVIIFLACTGLLGGAKVLESAAVKRKALDPGHSPPATAKPATPTPPSEKKSP